MNDPEFKGPADLTDVNQLIAEAESLAGGMDQQQIASQPNSALGGHPHPHYLYGRTAEVLRACVAALKKTAADKSGGGSGRPGSQPSGPEPGTPQAHASGSSPVPATTTTPTPAHAGTEVSQGAPNAPLQPPQTGSAASPETTPEKGRQQRR